MKKGPKMTKDTVPEGFSLALGLVDLVPVVFFGLGALGMVLMTVFALRLDPRDPKANWLEQAVNGAAQLYFFIGLMLV